MVPASIAQHRSRFENVMGESSALHDGVNGCQEWRRS
jgi:hypothetical protein